ncbi:MAG: hypothetical protein ACREUU_18950 [Gammaproteobacteria bacterium]
MLKMITSHLMLMAEVFGRNRGLRRSTESEDRPVSRLGRMFSFFGNRLRQHSPPMPMTNHLRRDIGLDPLPERSDWNW